MENKNTLVITASILGASFIIAILIFSMTFKSTKNAEQNITVTGSAKKNITSDLGIQRGTLQATSNERKTAYQIIQQQMPLILKFLEDKGFKKDQIEVLGGIWQDKPVVIDGRIVTAKGVEAAILFGEKLVSVLAR